MPVGVFCCFSFCFVLIGVFLVVFVSCFVAFVVCLSLFLGFSYFGGGGVFHLHNSQFVLGKFCEVSHQSHKL